ncbi:hypothetical protein J0680_23155 [Vibrio parahaemolyticus]|nr:hypothetical protein [Vibrio parahaemolyticus]MBO0170243.1 hypothetical protein [Vibrio parahaemolyticus]
MKIKTGKTLHRIMYVNLFVITVVLACYVYLWNVLPDLFFGSIITPLTVLLSANLGVLSAVIAAMSSRRETIRQNTLDLLNKLDSDDEYWCEVDKLTCAINHFRQQRVRDKICHHSHLAECSCPFPTLGDVYQEFDKYIQSNENSKYALRVNNYQTKAHVRANLVLRKMEWLCERAENGLIDYSMLAKRKGVIINFIYDACRTIINQKIDSHTERYSIYGKATKTLVYNHLCNKRIRAKLYSEAVKQSEY